MTTPKIKGDFRNEISPTKTFFLKGNKFHDYSVIKQPDPAGCLSHFSVSHDVVAATPVF